MRSSFDVVIVGGGVVGASLACALGGGDLKVAVLDARAPAEPPTNDYDLRVSAITLASRAFFENLGAWDGMTRRRVARVSAMRVWDENGGHIEFDAAEIAEPELAYIIENSVIRAALVERLQQFTNVHWLCPVEIASMTIGDETAELTLADGRALSARLLVGADGAGSRVREAAGIGVDRHDLRQISIVATVRTSAPHDDIARQRFLATGPLAFLPLPDPHACSIVWSADTARGEALMALDDVAFRRELQSAFGDALGDVVSIGARAAFPLAITHARHYGRARVALIGDAAHTVHPLAGQGVNLGFLDAAELAGTIERSRARGADFGTRAALRRYERARKGGNLAMLGVTGGFRYLFSNRLPGVTPLRNIGLDIVNALPPLKNLIMRRASGLVGDLPRLARRPAQS